MYKVLKIFGVPLKMILLLSVYYAGFNWDEAKIGSLKEDVIAYVAHRKGDVIQSHDEAD